MVFLCGLFFPVGRLPFFLRPLAYALPLTYGADAVHGAVLGGNALSFALDFSLLGLFCAVLFALCILNIKKKWIL
jgi:ABC-2 type transport system permease protein